MNLIPDVPFPEEGDTITISCEVRHPCHEHIVPQWYKDNKPLKSLDRLEMRRNGRQYLLVIKDSNMYDSGNYIIDLNGRKRSLQLDVKGKFC